MEAGLGLPPPPGIRDTGDGVSQRNRGARIPFEQKEPDYLLCPPLRSSFASSSTPAGCLLQLKHGLDEAARGAKSHRKKNAIRKERIFRSRLLCTQTPSDQA
jgi:hypothetical protein